MTLLILLLYKTYFYYFCFAISFHKVCVLDYLILLLSIVFLAFSIILHSEALYFQILNLSNMFTFNKSGASSYGFELSDQSDNSSTQFPYTVDMSQSLMSGRDTTRRYIYRIEQMEADAVIWGPYKYFTERQKDNCRRVFFYGLRPGEITVKEEIKQEEADEVEDPTEKNRKCYHYFFA